MTGNDAARDAGAGRWAVEALLCAFVAAAAPLPFAARRPFGLGDEGFLFLLSQGWAAGEPLFSRYHLLYPTGQYSFYGALMRLFGDSMLVLRCGHALLGGVAAALLLLAARRAGAGPALAAALAAAATCAGAKPVSLVAAAPVVLAAVDLAVRRIPPRPWVVAVATCAGGLVPFREDSAILLLGVAVVAVGLRRRAVEVATVILPGLTLGFSPWLLLELVRGAGDPLAFTALCARRVLFLGGRLGDPTEVAWLWPPRIPADAVELATMAIPFLVVLLPLFYATLLAGQWWRQRRGEAVRPHLVAAGLLGFAYLPQFAWERPDLPHLRTHLPILAAVVVLAAARAPLVHRLAAGLLVAVLTAVPLLATLRAQTPPTRIYPCCQGARVGARLHGAPPWAGLPRRPGETLIVLGWSPGWYVLEGIKPGSRHLSTFPRHLPSAADHARLLDDLARPANRWVISPGGPALPVPDEAERLVARLYRLEHRWRGYELWQRRRHGEVSRAPRSDAARVVVSQASSSHSRADASRQSRVVCAFGYPADPFAARADNERYTPAGYGKGQIPCLLMLLGHNRTLDRSMP